jgi:hypothetical protein
MKPVLGGDGVIVGSVEGRGPQLEEALQLPLEVIWLTPMVVKHPLSQRLQEVGLAVHHLCQLWWWRWRCCIHTGLVVPTSRLLNGGLLQCGLLGDGLLHGSKKSSPATSAATTTTTTHGHGGRRAVV